MDKFDKLVSEIMESMVMGGAASIMGNPASGEIGASGGSVGNVDNYATGDARIPKILGGIAKRNRTPLTTTKKARKKNS